MDEKMLNVGFCNFFGPKIEAMVGKEFCQIDVDDFLEGKDKFGDYKLLKIRLLAQTKQLVFHGRIYYYDGFIIFETLYHEKIKGKKNKHLFGNPYVSFPSFAYEESQRNLSFLSYKRQAPFNYPLQWFGHAGDSLRQGKHIPLIAMNNDYETGVLSPLNHLLYNTVSICHETKRVRCGIPRGVKEIKEHISSKTILVYGKGIVKTIDRWGSLLRKYYGIEKVGKQEDVLLKYISYWTNAGSAYWYNVIGKKSYDKTLEALAADHRARGIHFGSYQLDSWWYHREGDHYTAGITNWEPKVVVKSKNFNSVLPKIQKFKELELFKDMTIYSVQAMLGTPIGCHFKQLSNDSVYTRENPDDFVMENFAMPKNYEVAYTLFKNIFTHPKWKLSYIIHDWLHLMNEKHSYFKDMELGPMYFEALDNVLMDLTSEENQSGHVSLQLCMTQPHMTLESVTMSSVTSIRATSDSDSFFVEGTKRWWWFAFSSTLIHALGKYSFYDNRYSNKNHFWPMSAYSEFEFIWLVLSCGPIGIGDPIGEMDTELVKKTILGDGEIIKPGEPAKVVDACFLHDMHNLKTSKPMVIYGFNYIPISKASQVTEREKWQGQTRIEEEGIRVSYLLCFNTHPFAKKVQLQMRLSEIGLVGGGEYLVYDYRTGISRLCTAKELIDEAITRRNYFYYVVSEIVRGIAIIGDINKFATASDQLIEEVFISDHVIRIKGFETGNSEINLIVYLEKEVKMATINDRSCLMSALNSRYDHVTGNLWQIKGKSHDTSQGKLYEVSIYLED